jgi:hypothetical protein
MWLDEWADSVKMISFDCPGCKEWQKHGIACEKFILHGIARNCAMLACAVLTQK